MSEPLTTVFASFAIDERATLQVLSPNGDGKKYLVVPTQYFDMTVEEQINIDGAVLIPFSQQ